MNEGNSGDVNFLKEAKAQKALYAERIINYIRLVIISVNTLVFFVFPDTFPHKALTWIIIVAAFAYVGYMLVFRPYRQYPILLTSYFTSITDAGLITLWVYASGAIDSQFFLLYFISILAISMRFSFQVTLKVAAMYFVLYLGVLVLSGTNLMEYAYEISLRSFYLFSVAVLAGYFSKDSLEHIKARLQIKNSEQQLKKSESMLNDAQAIAHVGSFEWDMVKDEVIWSDELYRIYGYAPGEIKLSSATHSSHVHPNDRERVMQTITQALQEKKTFYQDYRIVTKDKHIRTIRTIGKIGVNEENNPVRITGSCHDITEVKKAEETLKRAHALLEEKVKERTRELEKSKSKLEQEIKERKKAEENLQISIQKLNENNKELQRINEDIDNFVYAASHDLKSPILNIEALLNFLNQGPNDRNQEEEEINSKLHLCVYKMKNTIENLSKVAKAQKEVYEDVANCDISQVLQEVITENEEVIKNSKAEILTDFKNLPTVFYSHTSMKSILYNFLTNAIKYRSPDRPPVIKFQTTESEDYTILEICDNGLGIDLKKHKGKLFTIFKRFHDHVEGTGIGLYMVNRIVEKNNGKIEVESEPGKGTIFKVYFKKEATTA